MVRSARSLVTNLAVAAGALVLTLLALELGFRIHRFLEPADSLAQVNPSVDLPPDRQAKLGHLIRIATNPKIVYELKPDLQAIYEGAVVEINSHGFRGRLSERSRDDDSVRLVGIGDSFMFGLGVAEGEYYLAVLEQLLRRECRGTRVEVVNTAVPGYNTVMEVETLRDKGIGLRPDLVIIEFVGNDLTLPNFVQTRESVFSLHHSFLADTIRERLTAEDTGGVLRTLQKHGLAIVPRNEPDALGRTTDPEAVPARYRFLVGWAAYEQAMLTLRGLADEHSFEVLSIALGAPDGARKRRALEISRELGFHVLDVGEAFQSYLEEQGFETYLGSPLALSATDGHPSALGHRVAAEAIFEYLTSKDALLQCEALATSESHYLPG